MATYTRETRVHAPFSEVWAFHSDERGLVALTPDWMNLEVEHVVGPDGESNPEVLEEGARIEATMRPLGVGPRQSWTSVIAERGEADGSAYFIDTMEDGPFPHWEHTHRFFADGDDTIVSDRIEYQLPGGRIGETVSPLAVVGFEPMFRYRHRTTKQLLE